MPYKRRTIREKVLQALYAYEITHDPVETIHEYTINEFQENHEAYEFAKSLIKHTLDAQELLDELIRKRVTNWEFTRIALIDKLILRMTICEFLFFENIPPKVSINEAIEIAKRYSTENSGRFVNGVLDAVLEDLKKQNKLKKSGRGLIDTSIHSTEDQNNKS